MNFRTSEKLQRYEFVRFHLDNVIEQPPNGQAQKKQAIDSLSMKDQPYSIFIMDILRSPKSFKNELMALVMQPLIVLL